MPDSQTITADDIGPEIKKVAQDLANAAGLDGNNETIWRDFITQARQLVRANRFI